MPLKLRLCTASGAALDLPHVVVHATGLTQLSGSASGQVLASGQANPDNDFRYDSGSQQYVFNLKTTGLAQGTWALQFTVDGQASSGYAVQFGVR